MKLSHIMGTVTIIAIVGGTIYAIKKHKDLQKIEGEEITLAEARDILAQKQAGESVHFVVDIDEVTETQPLDEKEMYILKEGVRETADFNRSFEPYDDDEEEEYLVDDIEGPSIEEEIDDSDIGRFTEEDRKLRYEPSSLEALKQYKRMELADLNYNDETYQTMLRLFDFPFEPQNDGDHMLRTQIIDYRVQFFGFSSKWVQDITFADVILHYARNAQFNCDETVAYWIEYFLDFNDLYYQYSSNALEAAINTLNAHQYFNEERQTFGLFGLTRNSMDQAIKNASRNFDNSVTYEIEFNEFLKSIL